jgi:hypothetical protein
MQRKLGKKELAVSHSELAVQRLVVQEISFSWFSTEPPLKILVAQTLSGQHLH